MRLITSATAAALALSLAACGSPSEDKTAEGTATTSEASPAATVADAKPAAFGQCAACHAVEPGKHGVGPSLAGVYGTKSGAIPGYDFSDAMKNANLTENALFAAIEAQLQAKFGGKGARVVADNLRVVKRGYTEICIRPGSTDIGVRRVETSEDARNRINVSRVTLAKGQQQFLRVSDQAGTEPVVQTITATLADSELAQARQQIHTVSRASSVVSCEVPPAVVVAPSAPQVISLASDALFPFGKSGLNDMLQGGRVALDGVVDRVKTEYSAVESIKVIGHSDPIGRPVDKQIISSQRAQTVRDYLSSRGLQSTQILSVGRADSEPAVPGCGNRPTPDSIQCNAPNRRVAIEISGTRR